MFTKEISRATTKINLTTGRGNNPVKCLPIIISNNKDRLSKVRIKISSNLLPVSSSQGNLNPVIHKADNKWTGPLKTEARELKTIIGRNNSAVVGVGQAEEVAAVEAVVVEEDKILKGQND